MLGAGNALILRLSCKTFAEFNIVFHNRMSDDYVLQITHHKSFQECKQSCLSDARCQSVSFKAVNDTECRLHGDIPETHVGDLMLKNLSGWIFTTTNDSEPLVSVNFSMHYLPASLTFSNNFIKFVL